MSATVTNLGGAGIRTGGITVENEPIIKSDGSGEVMQWQPSDGEADGIFISENSAGDPLRLGIGTSTVNRALEIAGNNNAGAKANYIRITDTDTSATADNEQGGIEFYTSDATAGIAASIEVLYAGSGGGGEFTFNTAASSSAGVVEAMRIDENGNVGIGTSPTVIASYTALTISGDYGGVIDLKNGSTEDLRLLSQSTQSFVGTQSATPLILRTAGAEAMRIDSAGNVGVGVAAPDNPLHVYKSASIGAHNYTNYPLKIESADTTGDFWNNQGAGIQFENTASSGAFISAEIVGTTEGADGTKGTLEFRTSTSSTPTTRLTIDSAGTVFTNTTVKQALSINATHANGSYQTWENSGTAVFYIGNRKAVSASEATYGEGTDLYATAGRGISFHTNATIAPRLIISSAGDSTFTGTVTAAAFDGTLGATTPATVAATTLSASGNVTLTNSGTSITGGAVDGYVYLGNSNSQAYVQANGSSKASLPNHLLLGAAGVTKATVSSTGLAVTGTITSTAGITVGSLDVGHGLGGDTSNVAVGYAALDESISGSVNNVAIGKSALGEFKNVGGNNTAIGNQSSAGLLGHAIGAAGIENTALGSQSLYTTADGIGNTAVGFAAMMSGDCADDNTAIGRNALKVFTGSGATAVGSGAAAAAESAANLTAIGAGAAAGAIDASGLTAVGKNALTAATGHNNTAVGYAAGDGIVGGVSNTAIGSAALSDVAVNDNTAVGRLALYAFTGSDATAVGSGAADAATSATGLTAVGKGAGGKITTGASNTIVGVDAGKSMTTTTGNVMVGVGAGSYALGSSATYVGWQAGYYAGNSEHCVAIGRNAMLGAAGVTNATCDYNNDPTITHDADANIAAGQYVTGTGIPEGAVISSITDSTHFELSAATTGGAVTNGTLTFYKTTGDYNVAIGSYALDATTTGNLNVAVGYYAGSALTTATNCVAIGNNSLQTEDAGHNSVAVGYGALQDQNVDNSNNTAVGSKAGLNLTLGVDSVYVGFKAGGLGIITGASNVVIGKEAGYDLTSGNSNVLIGRDAGSNITTAQNNTVIGKGAWATGVGVASGGAAGQYNVIVGGDAGNDLTSGHSNTLLGYATGGNFTDNAYNVAIGSYALDGCDGGETGNIAIGHGALSSDIAGSDYCVAIGHNALSAQNANVKNTAIGGLAGDAITSGNRNTLLGYSAGSDLAAHSDNVAIGHNAGVNAAANYNTIVGSLAGSSADNATTAQLTGASNVLVGYAAGYDLTTGPGNVLIGTSAGENMTSGDYNVAIGFQAADGLAGGSDYNIAIGYDALGGSTLGSHSIAIGANALLVAHNSTSKNLAIGASAGQTISTGTQNVLIGHEAGSTIAAANNNTAVGYNALKLATGGDSTAVGYLAGAAISTGGFNTTVGAYALALANGDEDNNTVVGWAALYNMNDDAADGNVALGYEAGRWYDATPQTTTDVDGDGTLTKAINCVYIGAGAKGAHATAGDQEIVIGYNAVGHGNNTMTLGNAALSGLHCEEALSTWSDRRVKQNINDNSIGLDFLNKLETVNFTKINPADWPWGLKPSQYTNREHQELVTPAVEAAEAVYEDAIVQDARAATVEETRDEVHAAIEEVTEDVVTPAAEAVYEDQVVVHAEAERTETNVTTHAEAERSETNITQEAREEIKSERHKFTEAEVTETVTGEEIVEVDGKWTKQATSEEVTRTERTLVYEDCDLYDEDGSLCTTCVTEAVEAVAAVVGVDAVEAVEAVAAVVGVDAIEAVAATLYEEGDTLPEGVSVGDEKTAAIEAVEFVEAVEAIEAVEAVAYVEAVEAVEAVAEVRENVVHKVAVMEEYISQTAQDEVTETIVTPAVEEVTETITVPAVEEVTERVCTREATEETTETRVVVEAADEWTETHITRPAEAAQEEVTERRLVSAAVEAVDAVYETVTVAADDRPADDDTVRLGLIAQDVQTAMTEAGVEFDIVNESPNGKLSLKYGNLVMPLIKAVQELSARVKTLEG